MILGISTQSEPVCEKTGVVSDLTCPRFRINACPKCVIRLPLESVAVTLMVIIPAKEFDAEMDGAMAKWRSVGIAPAGTDMETI